MDIFNVQVPQNEPETNHSHRGEMLVSVVTPSGPKQIGYVIESHKNGGGLFSAIAQFDGGRKRACGAFLSADHAKQVLIEKYHEDPLFCSRPSSKASRKNRVTAYRALAVALLSFYDKEILPRSTKPSVDNSGFLSCWITLGRYLPKKYKALLAEETAVKQS